MIDPQKLIANPKNPNKHSEAQISLIARLIDFHGFRHPVIVSKRSNQVVAGHGRILASLKLGLREVPVDYQDFESEAQEYAFMVSDNAISEWSELDFSMINSELPELGPDFDTLLLAIEHFEIEPADKESKKKETTCPHCGETFIK